MKLPNIKLAEYLALDDRIDYDFAIRYSKQCEARDVLSFGDMTKQSFGDVKDYQYLFTKDDCLNRFIDKYGAKRLKRLNVFDFFAFFRYMAEQVSRINRIENELLSHAPSGDEEQAGLDRFNRFGNMIQVDNLAQGKIWLYSTVRSIIYEDALFKLSLDKERADYQKDLQKIALRKSKN